MGEAEGKLVSGWLITIFKVTLPTHPVHSQPETRHSSKNHTTPTTTP